MRQIIEAIKAGRTLAGAWVEPAPSVPLVHRPTPNQTNLQYLKETPPVRHEDKQLPCAATAV